MVHAQCAHYEASTCDSDIWHIECLRCRLVIQVLEVHLDAELLKCFELVAISIILVEMTAKNITIELATGTQDLARKGIVGLPPVQFKWKSNVIIDGWGISTRGLLIGLREPQIQNVVFTLPERVNAVLITRRWAVLELNSRQNTVGKFIGPEVALMVVVDGTNGIFELCLSRRTLIFALFLLRWHLV